VIAVEKVRHKPVTTMARTVIALRVVVFGHDVVAIRSIQNGII
jgi:hypothetical protein